MAENENADLEEIIEKDILLDKNESSTTELEASQISENVQVQTTDTGEAAEVQITDTEEPNANEVQTNDGGEASKAEYVEAESDETFDHPCQPCLSEEKNIESKKFCANCEEYLCEVCVQYHQKFSITKTHRLLNKADVKSNDKLKIMKPLETCPHHVGKKLELFCEDHDKLCCSSCKATDHRKCVNVMIEDAASEVRGGEELLQTTNMLKSLQHELRNLILQREDNAKQIITEGDHAVNVLTKSKADIIEKIEKLSKSDENKINSKLAEYSGVIQEDIQNCEEVVSMVNSVSIILENDTYDERYIFTQMKKAQKNIESAKRVISAVSHNIGAEKIVYAEDKLMITTLEGFKGIGTVDNESRIYKKTSSKNLRMVMKDEITTDECSICIINLGWILTTDWKNEKLKLLNLSTFKVEDSVEFDHSPFDICKVSDSRVAVTVMYAKRVQFVSVNIPNIKKEFKTIETGEKCRGIAYLKSQLFVACGGFGAAMKEGPGHIRVFSLDGEFKRSIMVDQTGFLVTKRPLKLMFSSASRELYIVDLLLGILKIGPHDDPPHSDFIRKGKSYQGGICFDEHEHIFLADYKRNVIEQIDRDGKLVGTILTKKDGIDKPLAVAYDNQTKQLVVGMKKSSNLLVFQLEYD